MERQAKRDAAGDATVASWLDALVGRVEREAARGQRIAEGMGRRLMRNLERAEQPKRRRDERAAAAAERASQADEGVRPYAGGLWAVNRILHVAKLPRRGVKYLVRWKGGGDDEWRSLGDIEMENKEVVARRWERAAFCAFSVRQGRRRRARHGHLGWQLYGSRERSAVTASSGGGGSAGTVIR